MVVRTSVHHDDGSELLVVLALAGRATEIRRAPSPDRAQKVALLMIASRDGLEPGDVLAIMKAGAVIELFGDEHLP